VTKFNATHKNLRVVLTPVQDTFCLPFGVFVMRNSFMAFPNDLEEAAYTEGAKVLTTLRKVLLPLVMPGVATTMLYSVPCAVLYVALQRFCVSGISAGGIKG
jgi:multiple sugar transport system permease protein